MLPDRQMAQALLGIAGYGEPICLNSLAEGVVLRSNILQIGRTSRPPNPTKISGDYETRLMSDIRVASKGQAV
jgi:hypothetical protein